MWDSGTVAMVGDLYGTESKSQVYGTLHTFLHENEEVKHKLGNVDKMFLLHVCFINHALNLS